VTLGTTGWGVSFKAWVELKGIAKHDGMFRLIKLEEENETKFSPWGFEI
jgi:acyl-CoA-binding protein